MNRACTPPPPRIWKRERNARRATIFTALALVALWVFISFPVFSGRVGGQDFNFHVQRIASIAQGLDTGFPVYLYPGFSWHYGYPSGIFYGDAFLYPFALMVRFESKPSHPKEVSFTNTIRTNFTFTLHARNTSQEPGWLDFPVWNYPGYKAVTSKGDKLGVADGDNRRVRVYLPPRFNDTFTLRWVAPWYWRVAHWVSWVSMAALLLWAFTPLPRWLACQRWQLPRLTARASAPW